MRFLLSLLLVLMTGCSFIAPKSSILNETNYLVDLDDAEIFAISPDDDLIAYVHDGLHLFRMSDGYTSQLTYDSPHAISWSPNGKTLIASMREGEKTRLVGLTADQDDRPQVFIDEIISDIVWRSENELLAIGYIIDETENPAEIKVNLLKWNEQSYVERYELYSLPYEPAFLDPYEPFYLHLDLSAFNDEIVYNRYLSAPGVDSLQELVLYNLLSQKEKVLHQVRGRKLAARYSADSSALVLPQDVGNTQLYDPWRGLKLREWPITSYNLQSARGRDLYFSAGYVFTKDRTLLTLPAESQVVFSHNARFVLAAWNSKLYRVSGLLPPSLKEYSTMEILRLQQLRLKRSLGEINQQQYEYFKKNISTP